MYLRELATTLRRRWYLAIVGLIGTAVLCAATLSLYPATYQAEANIVLLPPTSTVEKGGNPYLQLGNLSQVVDVMIRALNSQSAVQQTVAIAPTGTYEVAPDYTTSGPIFVITAQDVTPEATLATLKAVSDKVAPTLAGLQESLAIAPPSQITSTVLTSDGQPSTVRKTQLRALIVAAAVGLIFSAMLIALIDSFLRRRNARRAISPSVIAAPDSVDADADADADAEVEVEGRFEGSTAVVSRPRRLGLPSAGRATTDNKVLLGSGPSADSRHRR